MSRERWTFGTTEKLTFIANFTILRLGMKQLLADSQLRNVSIIVIDKNKAGWVDNYLLLDLRPPALPAPRSQAFWATFFSVSLLPVSLSLRLLPLERSQRERKYWFCVDFGCWQLGAGWGKVNSNKLSSNYNWFQNETLRNENLINSICFPKRSILRVTKVRFNNHLRVPSRVFSSHQ